MKRYDYELVGHSYRIFDLKNSRYTIARCGDVTSAIRIVDLLNAQEDAITQWGIRVA